MESSGAQRNTTEGGLFEFAFKQTDIDGLCQPRFIESPEFEHHNDAFGMNVLLKEYAGLPWEYPLRLTMEHGLKFDDNATMLGMDTRFETILTPSILRADIINKTSDKKAIPVGFFALHAKALFSKFQLPPVAESDRRGTLVFPFKSTPGTTVIFDHDAFAGEILALPEKFHPVHVCVYWSDVKNGVHEIYRNAGIPVVTAGHRYDPLFMFRILDLCRRFRYAASNELATNLFISFDSGCRFFFLPGPGYKREIGENKRVDDRTGSTYEENRATFRTLFADLRDEPPEEQRVFVKRYLGKDSFVSPRELRGIILKAQRRYEGRPWWHSSRRLLAPPKADDFSWGEMAPNRGWYFPEKHGDADVRWMGQTDEAWVDLTWKHRSPALVRCHIYSAATSEVKVFVNGISIKKPKVCPDSVGYWLEGRAPAEAFENPPAKEIVRITVKVTGAFCPNEVDPENAEIRRLGVAISRFMLKQEEP